MGSDPGERPHHGSCLPAGDLRQGGGWPVVQGHRYRHLVRGGPEPLCLDHGDPMLLCENPACRGTKSFEFVQEESEFIDSQELRIQEYPEELPPGQTPRSLDIRLIGRDIVDVARPGDRVFAAGIVRAEARTYPRTGKLRAFGLYIEANFVDTTGKDLEALIVLPEEEEQI